MAIEFWGVEVRPGTAISCGVTEGYVIHLSQAALGETKKGSENVVVSVKVDEKKLVLGTLSLEKHPQIMCDLIFEKDFELSHSSKTASVFLCGYKSEIPAEFESDSGEDEETQTIEIPMHSNEIKLPADGKKDKPEIDEDMSSGDDDFSDSDDSDMSEDESSDEDEVSSGADPSDDSEDGTDDSDPSGDSEDGTDDSEEEQTPTPKKPEVVGKKRVIEPETPSGKKAKTEQSGDKGSQVKQASKTPAHKSAKTPIVVSKEKSPKSGSHACKSCNKTFGCESALASHQKAKKHEA